MGAPSVEVFTKLVVMAAILVVSSCKRSEDSLPHPSPPNTRTTNVETSPVLTDVPERHVLTFQNYQDATDDPRAAVYVLDGKVLGVGDAGLDELLRTMDRWPGQSVLEGRWDRRGLSLSGKPSFYPPYAYRYRELYELIDRKGLSFEYPPDALGRRRYPTTARVQSGNGRQIRNMQESLSEGPLAPR